MSTINKIVLVSFGSLEYKNGSYYGKNQVVKYAQEMLDYFEKVVFFGNESYRDEYNTMVGNKNIVLYFTGLEVKEEETTFDFIRMINSYRNMINEVDSQSAVLINSPALMYTPLLPILYYRSGYFATYSASDPRQVAELLNEKSGYLSKVKSKLVMIHAKFSNIFSDVIFTRGSNEWIDNKEKVIVSKPIINIEDENKDVSDVDIGDPINIMYCGSLKYRKGVDNLIKTVCNINNVDGRALKLYIVGNGEARGQLEDLRDRLSLQDRVEFVGWVDDSELLAEYFITCDVLVVPSRKAEGQPRVIDEAQYYGTPVIATDLGYPDDLQHKDNIYFIDNSESDIMEAALTELITDRKLYRKLSKNGRNRTNNLLQETAASQHSRHILDHINK